MILQKSAITTLKLGTSSREQYNIIVLDLLWINPYRLPYSLQLASLMLGIFERSSAKHAEEISPNPYRFPHTSKRISFMPRIFEYKPLSFPMQFKRHITNAEDIWAQTPIVLQEFQRKHEFPLNRTPIVSHYFRTNPSGNPYRFPRLLLPRGNFGVSLKKTLSFSRLWA